MILVIPMAHVMHDLLPTETLCRQFTFRPINLVECLILEWFRYRTKTGVYGLNHIFPVTVRTVIDSVIPEFISSDDRIMMSRDANTVERVIAETGYQVMDTLHSYVDLMDIGHLITCPADIVQWAGDTVIVRLP